MPEPSATVSGDRVALAVLIGFESDPADPVYSRPADGGSILEQSLDMARNHAERVGVVGDVSTGRSRGLGRADEPLSALLAEAIVGEDPHSLVALHDLAWSTVDGATWERACRAGGDAPVVPAVEVTDTVRNGAGVLVDRTRLVQCQSPRVYRRDVLDDLLATDGAGDLVALSRWAGDVVLVEGDRAARPVVHPRDIVLASARISS